MQREPSASHDADPNVPAVDPVVLLVSVDVQRSERLAYALVQEGYEVVILESRKELRKAIIEVCPDLILLDYTDESVAAGFTVPVIARYLGGDALGLAPPLLVITSSSLQAQIPPWPGVFHIVAPASLALLFAVVREHIQV